MTAPSLSLTEQMSRRRPVMGAPVAHGASDHLKRSIGTFQLTLFGVGATVGTGIFFVLSAAVPEAGPAVIVSFIIAGIAAGLSAICYAEMASSVPVSGSTYSYAYTTLGEFAAMGVAACLLLEYGVSISAVAVGWSGYLNELLSNLFGVEIPQSLTSAPWDATPGIINLPAVILIVLCTLLLLRGASESALVNSIMVIIKLGVLLMFIVIAFTAYNSDHFAGFWDSGFAGITAAASTIFFSYIGLDAVSTAGDEVKDPQHTMPRAIMGALITVTSVYVLVAIAALGSQPTAEFSSEEQADAGLAVILENITGGTWASMILSAGAVISIFSVSLVVMYGQTRILFAMGRDGLLPSMFAKVNPRTMTPVNNTIIVAVVVAILAGFVPLDYLLDMVSIGTLVAFIVVSVGVIILRVREPDLPRAFKVPLYPITPILSVLACLWILAGLKWYTWLWFGAWVGVALLFYLFWSRKHSALNPGGSDGYIPSAVPGDDDVMFVTEPKDHHFVTPPKPKEEP
jgi:APA family basic amino acid/polyamine antiporter